MYLAMVSFGDLVAKQGEFGLDAPAAPGGVFARHASDEVAKLGVELRAADRVRPALPPPVELEASAVCHASTVAGWTMTRLDRQPAQTRHSQTQRTRSHRARRVHDGAIWVFSFAGIRT
jgi:hypothetical protein